MRLISEARPSGPITGRDTAPSSVLGIDDIQKGAELHVNPRIHPVWCHRCGWWSVEWCKLLNSLLDCPNDANRPRSITLRMHCDGSSFISHFVAARRSRCNASARSRHIARHLRCRLSAHFRSGPDPIWRSTNAVQSRDFLKPTADQTERVGNVLRRPIGREKEMAR